MCFLIIQLLFSFVPLCTSSPALTLALEFRLCSALLFLSIGNVFISSAFPQDPEPQRGLTNICALNWEFAAQRLKQIWSKDKCYSSAQLPATSTGEEPHWSPVTCEASAKIPSLHTSSPLCFHSHYNRTPWLYIAASKESSKEKGFYLEQKEPYTF